MDNVITKRHDKRLCTEHAGGLLIPFLLLAPPPARHPYCLGPLPGAGGGRPRSAPRRSCSPTAHSGRAARGVSRPPVRAPLCRAEQLRPTGAWTVSGGGAQHRSYFTDLLDSEGLRHDFNNTPDLVPSPSSLSPCVHVDVVLCPHLDVVVANMVYF